MNDFRYTNIAFISYKREDEAWAKWLQNKMEHYKLPTEVLKENPDLEFKDRPRHVFKDTTDLCGGILADAIRNGLRTSKYLIVICSPRAAKSPWVCKEVQEFIDLGRDEYIIPFIIDGEPYAKNPENECFPAALKSLAGERELLGININENGRDSASVKVIARMFSLRFDVLWNRFQREAKRRRRYVTFGFIIAILFLLGIIAAGAWSYNEIEKQKVVAESETKRANTERDKATLANKKLVWANDSIAKQKSCLQKAYDDLTRTQSKLEKTNSDLSERNRQLQEEKDNVLKANWKMMENQSRVICEKAMKLIEDGDVYRGLCLLGEIYPSDENKRPYIPEMEQVAMAAYDSINFGSTCLLQMKGHERELIDGCLFNDELITASNDGTVRFWSIYTGCENLQKRISTKYSIISLDASNDKKWVVLSIITNGKYQLCLYENHNGTYRLVRNLGVGAAPMFMPDGTMQSFTYGDSKRYLTIWNTETWSKQTKIIEENPDYKYSKDRKFCVTRTTDTTVVYVKDARRDSIIYSYPIKELPFNNVLKESFTRALFSKNNNYLVLYIDDKASIIDMKSGNIISNIKIRGYFKYVNFDKKEKYLYYIDGWENKEVLRCFDISKCQENKDFAIQLKSSSRTLLFDEEEKYLYNLSEDGVIYKHLLSSNKRDDIIYVSDTTVQGYVRYSGDRKYQMNLISGKMLIVNDLSDAKSIHLIHSDAGGFDGYDISPDGKQLVSVGNLDYQNIVEIWDLKSGKIIGTGFEHSAVIKSIAFSANGKYLATGDYNNQIIIWDYLTGEKIKTLYGHANIVTNLAFYDEDNKILSESNDGTARFWDWKAGVEISEKQIKLREGLWSACLSPDEKYVCTSDKNYLYIWDYKTMLLLRKIKCKGAERTWWINDTLYVCCATWLRNNIMSTHHIYSYVMPDIYSFLNMKFNELGSMMLSDSERKKYYLMK